MQAQFHELCVDVYTVYTVRDNLHQGRGGRATARRPQPQPGNQLGGLHSVLNPKERGGTPGSTIRGAIEVSLPARRQTGTTCPHLFTSADSLSEGRV